MLVVVVVLAPLFWHSSLWRDCHCFRAFHCRVLAMSWWACSFFRSCIPQRVDGPAFLLQYAFLLDEESDMNNNLVVLLLVGYLSLDVVPCCDLVVFAVFSLAIYSFAYDPPYFREVSWKINICNGFKQNSPKWICSSLFPLLRHFQPAVQHSRCYLPSPFDRN